MKLLRQFLNNLHYVDGTIKTRLGSKYISQENSFLADKTVKDYVKYLKPISDICIGHML